MSDFRAQTTDRKTLKIKDFYLLKLQVTYWAFRCLFGQ